MTLLQIVLPATNNIPWGLIGTLITIVGAGIGYFIKQDKQIGKQADQITALEEQDKVREGELTALRNTISSQMETMKKDIMAEFKVQEREARELREKVIRMEERILNGIKKGLHSK
jgi:uncharacterized protein HemX